MEIEVATPEQQAELDSMSVEQLEQRVSQEEGSAPPPQGEATGQAQGEAVGSQQQTEAPKADAEPAWFTAYKAEQKRELSSYRNLQGLSDKLPKLIEQQVNQRMAALQQAQNNANLSPEDQQAQAQLQAQQEQWEKFVREKSRAEFGDAAKPYLEFMNKQMEKEADSNFKASALDLVKEVIPEKADEAWQGIFKQSFEDLQAGKPGAIERQERLEKDPSYVALEMIKAARSQVQNQATQVTTQRSNAARQAAQGAKITAPAPSNGKKSVSEMSQAELDSMSIADLEAAIP